MAHLTSSPFSKNSAQFEYPQRHPLSPPETTADSPATVTATPATVPGQLPSRSVLDHEELSARLSDSPNARFRRISTLGYHHTSALRDNRERTPQSRSSKPLVIVIPPSTILHEHGQLGHTLSQGPPHRLSQGILMPLFPTMYGQLTAIAREFNFPSTSGLCIYYHFSESGFVSTPRVSDESWPFIWGHVFEDRPGLSPSRPPINGKIEFDIDTRRARWYPSWLGSSRLERPMSASPSVVHVADHARIESKTTSPEDTATDLVETPLRPRGRHVPRKLSLVDRYETMSARSTTAPASGSLIPSPPAALNDPHAHLSPIPQADEPLSAQTDLEKKVTSWRNSATLRPSPLALKGQTSLEPANMPNFVPLDEALPPGEEEMNLEDYAWSVSSQGPPDLDENESLSSVSRLPSIHLAHRVQGSVCLTPSVCTSFGPFDYDIYSPVSSVERLPTPDIARRVLDDAPSTPSTVTSWGPPLSYPPSPFSDRSLFSIDVAHRAVFSRPMTPETATSWGAPSWPNSPVDSERAISIHLDRRAETSPPLSPIDITSVDTSIPWPHVFSFVQHHVAEPSDIEIPVQVAPWPLVWPYHHQSQETIRTVELQSGLQAAPQELGDSPPGEDDNETMDDSANSVTHSQLIWPYNALPTSQQEHLPNVGPSTSDATRELQVGVEEDKEATEAGTTPGQLVWPYVAESVVGAVLKETVEPSLPIEPLVAVPVAVDLLEEGIAQAASSQLVWPYNTPEPPSFEQSTQGIDEAIAVATEEIDDVHATWQLIWPQNEHPTVNLVPPPDDQLTLNVSAMDEVAQAHATPWLLVWPYIHHETQASAQDTRPPTQSHQDATSALSVLLNQQHGYPYLSIYSEIYPHFDLYPVAPASQLAANFSVMVASGPSKPYPDNLFTIYPPGQSIAEAYPVFETSKPYPENLNEIYSPSTEPTVLQTRTSYPFNLAETYPSLDLYFGCSKPYPLNLDEIYRLIPGSQNGAISPVCVGISSSYPLLEIYPPAAYRSGSKPYPTNLEMYQPVSQSFTTIRIAPPENSRPYPENLNQLYPPGSFLSYVYPVTEIYPTARVSTASSSTAIRLDGGYPIFDLYPPVYPHLNIYPSISASEASRVVPSGQSNTGYPPFDLYPAIDKAFEMYPTPSSSSVSSPCPSFSLPVDSSLSMESRSSSVLAVTFPAVYPYFNLYPPVYPAIDIYPPALTGGPMLGEDSTAKLFTDYPTFNLYPAVYPHVEAYPAKYECALQQPLAPSPSVSEPQTILRPPSVVVQPPTPTPTRPAVFRRSPLPPVPSRVPVPRRRTTKLTHSELHAMVMMETSFDSRFDDDDDDDDAPAALPKFIPREAPAINLPPPRSLRRASISQTSLPLVPVSQGTSFPSRQPLDPTSTAPFAATSLKRSVSAASKPSPKFDQSSLNRMSIGLPSSPAALRQMSMASDLPIASHVKVPKRRDSLVLQRVRAYNAKDTGESFLNMDPISEFPLPPRPTRTTGP